MNPPFFHRFRRRARPAVASLRLPGVLCLVALVTLPPGLPAQAPAWWSRRGVLAPAAPANDFAAVNQGQLKQLATQALREMDERLPGGAGGSVHALVDPWAAAGARTNDYAPVNLGMLKTVAAPFYARLMEIGYASAYPWAGREASADDYAAANVGQAKNLFAFDFTAATAANDADHDGIADWWESYYFQGQSNLDLDAPAPRGDGLTVRQAFQQGLNPNDYYNGHVPALHKTGGDAQSGPPGALASLPLVVQVTDGGGKPYAGAPVRFAVASGEALLQLVSDAAFTPSAVALTNAAGYAHAYLRFPGAPLTSCAIAVSEVRGGQSAAAALAFTAASNNQAGGVGGSSPYAPSHVIETVNPDGSEDLSWENNPDNRAPIPLWSLVGGQWTQVATVPAGTNFHHFAAP